MSGSIFTEEEITFLKDNYSEKGSEWCSKNISKSRRQIIKKASKLKLKVSKDTIFGIWSKKSKKYHKDNPKPQSERPVNSEVFEFGYDNKDVAYICGFLWADGYFNNNGLIGIKIAEEDMKEIIHIFDKLGKWWRYRREKPNRKPVMVVGTTNKRLLSHLNSLGYQTGRLDMKKAIEFFSDNVKHHWWRGFLDGDGNIYCNKKNGYNISFSGPYNFNWSSLEELFKSLDINYSIRRAKRENSSFSEIKITRKSQVKIFGEYIYRDSESNRLERKYKKWTLSILKPYVV